MTVKAKGYLLGAIAAATYGMNPLFALPLYQEGMTPDSVLFFRYLIAIPILAIMIKVRRRNFKIKRNEILPLVIMGLLMAFSSLALFQSYNYMDAGIASTLLFVYPILVALIMTVFFREKITLLTVLCIVMALGGIFLLYKGGDGTTLSLTGTLLVMASSLSYAMYIVGVNRPQLKNIATLKITFYVLLFGLSLFLVRVDFGQSLMTPPKWHLWFNLLALAVFPTAISFLCTTVAIQYIGATSTAILGALEPVTAVFFGVTVFGESLTLRIVSGILLIIVAVTLIIAGTNIQTYLVRFRKMFPKLPPKHTPIRKKQLFLFGRDKTMNEKHDGR
ncbi:MAG TPA: EamA family transporter [Porphyromonadaceae bacterium]|nr:EamA family transporter [Porphyromonadaceae bacterium]